MKKYIEIEADHNDADYVTSRHKVTDKALAKLEPIIEAIKAQHGHNWDNSEYGDEDPATMYKGVLTQEQIDFFNDLVPYAEHGIHTITNIKLLVVAQEKDLLS